MNYTMQPNKTIQQACVTLRIHRAPELHIVAQHENIEGILIV